MNNVCYRIDKDGPCQKNTTLIFIFTLLALMLPQKAKAQETTPNPTHDVFMSVTFQAVVEGEETPTPSPTPPTTPLASPSPTPPTEILPPPIAKINLKIFGYAPSNTFVSLMGKNTLELTTSDTTGYFEFNNVPVPQTKGEVDFYPELCLQAYFQESSTQPTCLAPLPVGNSTYNIGPVILSPILIIEKGQATVNSQIKAVGKTTPNTEVSIFLAKEEQKTTIFDVIDKLKLIKTASAYYLPKYQIISDKNGNFEFNLPTDSSNLWRVFAASSFQGQNSPKSTTLSFFVVPQTFEFLQKLMLFIISLFSKLFFNLIIAELFVILILARLIRKERKRQ